MVANQVSEYQKLKVEKQNKRDATVAAEVAQRARIEEEQSGCAHKTGGMDYAGYWNGDGSLYGSCTSVHQLPTGEVYIICFRCQKEWHMPSKRAVLNGELSLADYYEQEKEYREALRWKRTAFQGVAGEWCAASQFRIPALERQRDKDNEEFAQFVQRQGGNQVNA